MLLLAVLACGIRSPEPPLPAIVIGHRGAPGHLPDHTLEGYRLAAEMGADFIEPDLVVTADGVLIARHENDLTHTTDVTTVFPNRKATKTIDGVEHTGWFAEDFSLAELRTLHAVQPYATRPHDHDGEYLIPTFDEILALRSQLSTELGRPIGVYPETKHPTYFASLGLPLEPRLIDALQKGHLTGPTDPVFVQSFEPQSLATVGRTLGVRRVLLIDAPDQHPFGDPRTYGEILSDLPALRKEVEAIGIHTSHAWTPSGPNDLVDHAHEAGLLVHVYTFRNELDKLGHAADGDPRLELRRFYELGVDGVFADYPDTAVEVRKALP